MNAPQRSAGAAPAPCPAPCPASRPAPRAQRGAALLTAMVIVTLVATLASAMVWQQWRAVQVEAAERSRMQSAWILTSALDWARLFLRADARSNRPTALTEPWATPLAEGRLSAFLAADKDHTDDALDAFLSGAITDAQSRYNLRNLVVDGKVSAPDLAVLRRLCELAGVAPGIAEALAGRLRDALADPAQQPDDAPLVPQSTAQLAWLGLDAATLQRLAPLVTLLPVATPVNLNTAPREVIAAAVAGLDLGGAERLLQARQRTPLRDAAGVAPLLPASAVIDPRQAAFRSDFFEVGGRLRLGDRVLEERSLVQRRGLEVLPLRRERTSLNVAPK